MGRSRLPFMACSLSRDLHGSGSSLIPSVLEDGRRPRPAPQMRSGPHQLRHYHKGNLGVKAIPVGGRDLKVTVGSLILSRASDGAVQNPSVSATSSLLFRSRTVASCRHL